jgi:uncharacterized protein (DUF2147 family)
MKRLLATAAFLLASTAAQAQYTFELGGHTIRIDPRRGIVSIPGIYDNTGHSKAKKAKTDGPRKQQVPQQAKVEPQPQLPGSAPAQAPVATPPAAEPLPAPAVAAPPAPPPVSPALSAPPPATTANSVPAETAEPPPPAPPPTQQQVAAAAAPGRDPNSPLGVWLTEEKEGKVRIEQCGANLCGYSVNARSNQNGEQVMVNMRPGNDQKWTGRIVDPSTGSTYESTIAMKGADRLRVQGCAFGGMFCGGQTWTRVN